MNFLDAGIIVILFYNIISGLRKGLIRSITDIFGMFLGIIFASSLYKNLVPFFQETFDINYTYAAITSFIVIWCLTLFIIFCIGALLHHFYAHKLLAPLNRLGGMFFGLFIGLLICILILTPLFYFNFKPAESSGLAQTFKPICLFAQEKWLPANLFDNFNISSVAANSGSSQINESSIRESFMNSLPKVKKNKTQPPKKLSEKQFEEILKKYKIDKSDLESMIEK